VSDARCRSFLPETSSVWVSGLLLWEWREKARQQARQADIDEGEVDWLLQRVANLDRLTLRLGRSHLPEHVKVDRSLTDLDRLWDRRILDRTPVQYLVGQVSWRHFDLVVSPDVLVPRPETEAIVDIAVEAAGDDRDGIWVDLGTGSGVIALGLAEALPEASIVAVDTSRAALDIARHNATAAGLFDRIEFRQGSWFDPLDALKGRIRGMVSNPPYIPSDLVPQLQPEVARHEPHLALDGGQDGLSALRHLARTAPAYLQPGGIWLVEHMAGQSESVCKILYDCKCYRDVRSIGDWAGFDRFVLAYYCPTSSQTP